VRPHGNRKAPFSYTKHRGAKNSGDLVSKQVNFTFKANLVYGILSAGFEKTKLGS
jgi:hypothetical protein